MYSTIGAAAYALQEGQAYPLVSSRLKASDSSIDEASSESASAPHKYGEEGDPVEVEGQVVRPCKGEKPQCLGFVLAVNGVSKLWDGVVLKSMGELLLVGVLALQVLPISTSPWGHGPSRRGKSAIAGV